MYSYVKGDNDDDDTCPLTYLRREDEPCTVNCHVFSRYLPRTLARLENREPTICPGENVPR